MMMMMMMMTTQYTLVLISVVDDSGNDICCWCLKFELVNESLVVKTLQGLKASKASGLDNISRVC